MSTEQTNSRKSKIQIPDGWLPTSGEDKGENVKPINEEEETKFQEMLEESVAIGMSLNPNASKEPDSDANTGKTIQAEDGNNALDSVQTELADAARSTVSKRTSGKQRKESLEEYRQTFLSVPKLEDRKPVFISREVRDKLDEIARKLGGRGRSVSGFIENLARHHLETYRDDVELWKKL